MHPQVLVVEDDPDTVTLLGTTLQGAGFAVVCADTIASARRLSTLLHRLDLVILDQVLPDGNGLDLAQALKTTHPDLPVVMVTARVDAGIGRQAAETCVDLRVTRPFDPDDLVVKLRALLARGRS